MKASEASGSYLVQVAHFARAEDAVSLLQKLIADGYDGTRAHAHRAGRRRRTGCSSVPTRPRRSAQAVARDLNATLGFTSLVIVEP